MIQFIRFSSANLFVRSEADKSLYNLWEDESFNLVLLYVDDLALGVEF